MREALVSRSPDTWDAVRRTLATIVTEVVAGTPPRLQVERITKGHQDYVTSLDLHYQRAICAALKEAFPDWPILAEEDAPGAAVSSGCWWIVDPLDGTFNFAHGLPFYGMSVALLHDGVSRVAAVYDFSKRCLYSASSGGGAFVGDEPVAPVRSAHRVIAVSSGVVDWAMSEKPDLLPALRELGKLRILGSQATQLAYVGCGFLSANISVEAKVWDDAAGALIAQESGAHYSDFNGNDFSALLKSGTAHALTLRSVACDAALWPILQPLLLNKR
jgi:myo-inositol-1(or 4)-monophosphatase